MAEPLRKSPHGHWTGVFPAVTTKFTEDDRLDIAEMERSFAQQTEAGVDGIIVCGSLGEASTLEMEEKIEVLKTASRVAAGAIPVLLTVVEGSTRRASKLAQLGAAAGADGFMVLPGVPYKSDARETMAHYRTVARAGGKPVMIYNNPVSYGVDITPEMLGELAEDPLFVAIKESSDDVRRVTRIFNTVGERFRVFTGVDNLALESLAVGAHGWVAGLVCAFPAETVAIHRLMQQGRLAEALAIYRWFQPLLDLDVSNRLVQNIKLVEALASGSNDRCRAPRMPLVGEERARVVAIVEKAMANRPGLPALAMAAE
jgi:4-hydroxy-tetrahydrodipicolinate synthase